MRHPGTILLEQFMVPKKISQNALARDLHVPPQRINEIVNGNRSITLDTALRLGFYFGNSPSFWLELQNYYNLEMAEETGLAADTRQKVRRPQSLQQRSGNRHKQIEDKALAIHKQIGKKLQNNPQLVLKKAQENIQKWGWDKQTCPAPFVTAWQHLLSMPLAQIIKIITSPGEKGTLLRSSSPFEGTLTAKEMDAALRTMNRERL